MVDLISKASQYWQFRQAHTQEVRAVQTVLLDAAQRLLHQGQPMWRPDELGEAQVAPEVQAGRFYLAEAGGQVGAVVRLQVDDSLFWPELPPRSALVIHRLAVASVWTGQGLSRFMLDQARALAVRMGLPSLRLDCESSRAALREVYLRYGFQWLDDRQVGPWHVSRMCLLLDP